MHSNNGRIILAKARIPDQPFVPADFSPRGGGIDYLGMRWVSLTILTEELIPGINNRTTDFGIYCLATWIPWKFHQLCEGSDQFTFSNFRRFEEAVGVAISFSLRPDSPSAETFGELHEKIGVQQKLELPSKLSFEEVDRTRSTSIFAAPLYGPSLRYLGLIGGHAIAEDGTSTDIPLIADTEAATVIAKTVDDAFLASANQEKFTSVDDLQEFDLTELDELANCGINPARYRNAPKGTRLAFLRQLLPDDSSNGRTKTARLVIETLSHSPGLTLEETRGVWHTGLFPDGEPFVLSDPELQVHRELWAVFQSRQYQRYVVELFMKCFEVSLGAHSDLDKIVLACVDSMKLKCLTLSDVINEEAEKVCADQDLDDVSEQWHRTVHAAHPSYIWIEDGEMADCETALRMLARWWIRIHNWIVTKHHEGILQLGGEDRISMSWFYHWVEERRDQPTEVFIRDVLEQLVFGQHIRVALSRFDGSSQKLRFLLGDDGIIPSKSAIDKMGKSIPGWTQDRLGAFVRLLCDIGVLEAESEGFVVGEMASEVYSNAP